MQQRLRMAGLRPIPSYAQGDNRGVGAGLRRAGDDEQAGTVMRNGRDISGLCELTRFRKSLRGNPPHSAGSSKEEIAPIRVPGKPRPPCSQPPVDIGPYGETRRLLVTDRKSKRLNSSHANISYAVF